MKYIIKILLLILSISSFYGCVFHIEDGTYNKKDIRSHLAPGYNTHDEFLEKLHIEINKVRDNPYFYAVEVLEPSLSRYNSYFYTNYDGKIIRTKEGKRAMEKCIFELKHSYSAKLLSMEKGLCNAAYHLADDQAKTGRKDEETSTYLSFKDRLKRYGAPSGFIGELREYDNENVKDIVIHLLVSDGDITRAGRCLILNDSFTKIGIGVAFKHAKTVTIIDLAEKYITD